MHEELHVRRLVIGGSDQSGPHAVIEAGRESVRLTMHGSGGHAPLVIEARSDGPARILIGDTRQGPSVEIEPEGVLVWLDGNVVATIRARAEGGAVDLCDRDGVRLLTLPNGQA